MGITDLDRVYDLHDLARGDVMFAATGVTDPSCDLLIRAPQEAAAGEAHRGAGVTPCAPGGAGAAR